MDTTTPALSEFRNFDSFVDYVFSGIGYRSSRENMGLYVQSRLMTIDRKNNEVSGAVLAPSADKADAYRQKLNRATLNDWATEPVVERLDRIAYELMPQALAWIIDSTGLPKKGDKSVGVSKQYCGELGKLTNCQTIVSTHLSTSTHSLPLLADLFLPEVWAYDPERRAEAGVPEEIEFRTKSQMAIDQVDRLIEAGFDPKTLVFDAAFGVKQKLRQQLQARKLTYQAAQRKDITVMRPQKLRHVDQETMTLGEVAKALHHKAWQTVTWREGSKRELSSRFAALRVVPAQGHSWKNELEEEQWLLIEWPEGKDEPSDYWFSNHGPRTSLRRLVKLAHVRWRIERDYQDMKQELGLGDYQGRSWRGFHHHLVMCMAAMVYLALHRRVFPPEAGAVDWTHPPRP